MMLFHRGKMRKKVWVSAGDIVLVGLREYKAANKQHAASSKQRRSRRKILISTQVSSDKVKRRLLDNNYRRFTVVPF